MSVLAKKACCVLLIVCSVASVAVGIHAVLYALGISHGIPMYVDEYLGSVRQNYICNQTGVCVPDGPETYSNPFIHSGLDYQMTLNIITTLNSHVSTTAMMGLFLIMAGVVTGLLTTLIYFTRG